MQKFKQTVRIALIYLLSLMMVGSYPVAAMAETAPESDTVAAPAETPPPSKPIYTYNPETGRWDGEKWQYDPDSGQYKTPEPVVSSSLPPETAAVESQPPETTQKDEAIREKLSTLTDTTVHTNATILNELKSKAISGDAHVNNNTKAGSARSGNANADTTIINALHSTVQGDTAGIAYFQSDIYGNVTGDITLSPAIDGAVKSSSGAPADTTLQLNDNNQIINDISLSAASGNANVTHNGQAGDATSGSANAVANVINLINSIIAANKSFIGTINIYGNLNGDILVSPEFIPQLLAYNVPDSSSNSLAGSLNDSQSIINNIALNAGSGQATVDHNTSAGNATTGTAATNLTVLNLTGRQVTAKNSLLVFVNVLGKWVGVIVDAPIGATSAALGSGVINNNSASGSLNQNIDVASTASITNNLTLNSQSGNANVVGNTSAGNATSGNATASANVLNISMSSFSISDWFGVLFINVFGSWYGSFGINTVSGEVIPLDAVTLPPPQMPAAPLLFKVGFTPRTLSTDTLDRAQEYFINQQNGNGGDSGGAVRFASTDLTGKSSLLGVFNGEKSPEINLLTSPTTIAGLVISMVGVMLEIARRRYSAKLA
ncbi:MAG: mucin7-like protein [Candidatus Saccharibacteria bacterium]|nr:mucin7-like protein [Candidatus Saccharibacteria bacterium]